MTKDEKELINACVTGDLGKVKTLLSEGADIHAWDDYALRYASENGQLEVVTYLVQEGADIHAREDYALRWSSINGHIEVVKFLEGCILQEKRLKNLWRLNE